MDDSAPGRSTHNGPHFPEPSVVFPSPGFNDPRFLSAGSSQPAPTLSSRPPAAHERPAMPILESTLDVEATGPFYPLSLPEQNTAGGSDVLADYLTRLVDISQQVLNTLQNSSIVEKGAGDDRSRFWTVYQKIAEEHDNEFIERHDSDMDIVLIFSGLFSAVNTAFITTMGPSDSITTNALLAQIVTLMAKENNGTYIGNILPVPPPPAYSDGQVWFQALAYTSLSFSLLAAFGAVLGKQWLRVYKLERLGHGSLEERGKSRQKKLEGLVAWRFNAVLQMFPVLLQLSLLLFGVSLSSYTWTQQRPFANIVIAATVLGCAFYGSTLFLSLLFPACPFQTTASLILHMTGAFIHTVKMVIKPDADSRTFIQRFRSFLHNIHQSISKLVRQLLDLKPPGDLTTGSALLWVLMTSTDPENITAAAALIPTTPLPPHSDITSCCQRLRDTFVNCFDADGRPRPLAEERAVHCGRALIHLCLNGVSIDTTSQQPRMWHAWRSIILPRAFDHCKTIADQLQTLTGKDKQLSGMDKQMVVKTRQICQADTRSALRVMIAAAGDGFIHPDEEKIIWRGRFTWNGDCRTAADFDWLVEYLKTCSNDDATKGDAILALSAMKELGSRDQACTYLEELVSALASDHSHVRYAVLRAVSESRMALVDAMEDSDEKMRNILRKLSRALPVVIPMESDLFVSNYFRNDAYLSLISALASDEQWCQRLVGDQHIGRCIFILNHLDRGSRAPFHLAAIFGRVYAACPDEAVFEAVTDTQFSSLAKLAWQSVLDLKLYEEDECINALPSVVNFTAQQEAIPTADLRDIRGNVRVITDKLKRRSKHPAILSSMEDYYTQLTRLCNT